MTDSKVSFLLNGGFDERTHDELVGPIVEQLGSPALAESENTRLSVAVGTCVRSPAHTAAVVLENECYGIVSNETTRNEVIFQRPITTAAHVLADAGRSTYGNGTLQSYQHGLYATDRQNHYFPVQIDQAGSIPGVPATTHISVAYDSSKELLWYAYGSNAPEQRLWIWATTTDGTVVCMPYSVQVGSFDNGWVGLTAHGANGVVAWYCTTEFATRYVYARKYTLSGNVLTEVSATQVYTPATHDIGFDVVRLDDTHAILIGPNTAAAATATIRKWNVATNTLTTSVDKGTTVGGAGSVTALAVETLSGATRIAYACSSITANATRYGLLDSSLADVFAIQTIAGVVGDLAVKFFVSGATERMILVRADIVGSVQSGATDTLGTTLYAIDTATGGIISTKAWKAWMTLANRGAQWNVSSTEKYPVFFTWRQYGDNVPNPITPDYVDDPCIMAWVYGSNAAGPSVGASCVARFGVVRGSANPARTANDLYLPSSGAIAFGNKVACTYRKNTYEQSALALNSYPGRYVVLDMNPWQPKVVYDHDGPAYVAAALPVQWDGSEVAEWHAGLHTPHITVANTGGSGDTLAAGVYTVRAMYQWTDGTGQIKRSRPSAAVSTTMAGGKMVVKVTGTDSFRDSINQGRIEVLLYVTEADESKLYLQKDEPTSYTASLTTFGSVSAPDTSQPTIYSVTGANGEELFPQPPPPLHDLALVGSRAVGIDGEYRSRAVLSKLRISGIGYEWFPAGEVTFPAGIGKLQAVFEYNGTALFFAERAIMQLSVDGPNNSGQGSGFQSPVKVSEYGCSNPASVVEVPGGVFMWQNGDRLMKLEGGVVSELLQVILDSDITGACVFRGQQEIVFYMNSASILVYNYLLKAFTRWGVSTHPYAVQNAVNLPYDQDALLVYSSSTKTVYLVDGNSVSSAPMSWETGWVMLDGDFQTSMELKNVLVNGTRIGSHGLRVEIFTNYDMSASENKTDITYAAATISALANALGKYTLFVEPKNTQSRAIKVRITEAPGEAGEGVRPGAVTLVFEPQAALHMEAISATAEG